jgi:hypothetical protein
MTTGFTKLKIRQATGVLDGLAWDAGGDLP